MKDWLKKVGRKIKWSLEDFFEAIKEHEKIILIIAGSLAGVALILFLIFGVACRGYNPDPNAIEMQCNSQDLLLTDCDDAVQMLSAKGFTNITTAKVQGFFFTKSGTIQKITIDGCENFYGYSKFSPNDLIIIYYYE